MGQHESQLDLAPEAIRAFTKSLLADLRALEQILADGIIESDKQRIGAEQEFFLVDSSWRPAPIATEIIDALESSGFTTELARFNIETNLDPLMLTGSCFSSLEKQLTERIALVRQEAAKHGADVVITGILPSLSKSDLSLDNMTPRPRYSALNEALTKMGGGSYALQIDGIDDLRVEHDSVMLESCNASFQVHLQVNAEKFAHVYNVAQALAGPMLAACVNSPLLFGKRLWAETRIALFQQSLDTRAASPHMRELAPRVRFGNRWIEDSVVEIFEDDIARFRVLMASEVEQDPFEELSNGRIPRLDALQLHNSTVYRWNRPCYGISEGKAHLRIECRCIPAGPSVKDEIANAAFWIGIVIGAAREWGDVTSEMDFDDAKGNFIAASRHGLNAVFHWKGGEGTNASELILQNLLPLARRGLEAAQVDPTDVNDYLQIVETRVRTGNTGAQWLLRSAASMKGQGTRAERMAALTAAMAGRERDGAPVHDWPLAKLDEAGGWKENYLRVEQYMITDLYTVNEDELIELVAFVMDRYKIRHVPVEDTNHRLVGLVSYRSLLRLLAKGEVNDTSLNRPVKDIMIHDLVTVTPETTTLEAIHLMRAKGVPILPVVKSEKLVGVVAESDFMPIASRLLEERLKET